MLEHGHSFAMKTSGAVGGNAVRRKNGQGTEASCIRKVARDVDAAGRIHGDGVPDIIRTQAARPLQPLPRAGGVVLRDEEV